MTTMRVFWAMTVIGTHRPMSSTYRSKASRTIGVVLANASSSAMVVQECHMFAVTN